MAEKNVSRFPSEHIVSIVVVDVVVVVEMNTSSFHFLRSPTAAYPTEFRDRNRLFSSHFLNICLETESEL